MEEPTAWRLVAALYLAQIENRPVDEAAGQLSLIYGHFPYLTSKTGAMDRSFRDYVEQILSHQSRRLRTKPTLPCRQISANRPFAACSRLDARYPPIFRT